jgi:DNA-binding NarL/FixJ family response regulator
MSIRIILADDHQMMIEGLRTLLANQPDMQVLGEARDGRAMVDLVKSCQPDLVIMDVSMPDMNGVEATRRILALFPRIRVLALSVHSDAHVVGEMLKAGAAGYVLKDCAFDELVRAIRAIMNNQMYLSSSLAGLVIEEYVRNLGQARSAASGLLTEREREVLQLLAEGKTTKQIAGLLFVSVKTVETHRQQIMDRLNIHSIAALTKYAIREGLTFLER